MYKELPESSPENLVKAPVGSVFTRTNEDFYLTVSGGRTKLNIPKKSFAVKYQDEIWFSLLSENGITFKTDGETWRKASGTGKKGWVKLSNKTTTVTVPSTSISYFLTSGNQTPIFGANGATSYPPSVNWTGLFDGDADDDFTQINLPFNFYHGGSSYDAVFVGTNTYTTFGAGSDEYDPLGVDNPPYPKFLFGAADHSYQRLSTYTHPDNDYVAIRYEGNDSTSGTQGDPGIVYELRIFNPSVVGGISVVELLVGIHNDTGGIFQTDDGVSTVYDSGTIQEYTSYVFYGNSDGTSYTRYDNYHIVPTTE